MMNHATRENLHNLQLNSVNATIIQTLNSVLFYSNNEDIVIRHNLASTLPSIAIDSVSMNRVLSKIFVNAIETMKNSREKILSITTRKTGRGIHIIITDTGTRIEDIGHIFDPFNNSKGKSANAGLSVCKAVIQAHNGSIEVTIQPDTGNCFTIFLPAEILPFHHKQKMESIF